MVSKLVDILKLRSAILDPTNGRGGGIRTHGLFVPNEARYQTALRPDILWRPAGKRAREAILDFGVRCKGIFCGSGQKCGLGGAAAGQTAKIRAEVPGGDESGALRPEGGKLDCGFGWADHFRLEMTNILKISLVALLGLVPLGAAEKIYTAPVMAAGANLAAVALPRDEWLQRVQANFDKSQGKSYDLIFDGDSITDGWQGGGKNVWAQHYGALQAVDFGIGGDRTQHVLWRLSKGQVDGKKPKLIVLMIGTNNLSSNTAEQIAEGVKAIVSEYMKRCPDAHLLLLGIFPRGAKATDPVRGMLADVNTRIAALDDGKRVTYLDIGARFLDANGVLSREIMPDLLHPNAKGYEIWAGAIQPEIDKYFAAPAAVPK